MHIYYSLAENISDKNRRSWSCRPTIHQGLSSKQYLRGHVLFRLRFVALTHTTPGCTRDMDSNANTTEKSKLNKSQINFDHQRTSHSNFDTLRVKVNSSLKDPATSPSALLNNTFLLSIGHNLMILPQILRRNHAAWSSTFDLYKWSEQDHDYDHTSCHNCFD